MKRTDEDVSLEAEYSPSREHSPDANLHQFEGVSEHAAQEYLESLEKKFEADIRKQYSE